LKALVAVAAFSNERAFALKQEKFKIKIHYFKSTMISEPILNFNISGSPFTVNEGSLYLARNGQKTIMGNSIHLTPTNVKDHIEYKQLETKHRNSRNHIYRLKRIIKQLRVDN
jgi:hypothetical protein